MSGCCFLVLQFVGAPCGRHGPYTFYKAFKYQDPEQQGRLRILSLGEFFFARISQEAPLCCAELQLLWEDRNNENILLSSVRLYFLPEHTPDGRQPFHGEVTNTRTSCFRAKLFSIYLFFNLKCHQKAKKKTKQRKKKFQLFAFY